MYTIHTWPSQPSPAASKPNDANHAMQALPTVIAPAASHLAKPTITSCRSSPAANLALQSSPAPSHHHQPPHTWPSQPSPAADHLQLLILHCNHHQLPVITNSRLAPGQANHHQLPIISSCQPCTAIITSSQSSPTAASHLAKPTIASS